MYGPPVQPPQPKLGLGRGVRRLDGLADQRRRGPLPPRDLYQLATQQSLSIDGHIRRAEPRGLHDAADAHEHAAAIAGDVERSGLRRGGAGLGSPSDRSTTATVEDQIAYAFRRCLSRPPHDKELKQLVALYNDSHASLADRPKGAREAGDCSTWESCRAEMNAVDAGRDDRRRQRAAQSGRDGFEAIEPAMNYAQNLRTSLAGISCRAPALVWARWLCRRCSARKLVPTCAIDAMQPLGRARRRICTAGQAGHLSAPDRLAAAPGHVRLQARAGQARRPGLPATIPQRAARSPSPPARPSCWARRASSPSTARAGVWLSDAVPQFHARRGRRDVRHPVDEHRSVQPRSGRAVALHRLAALRPARRWAPG